jgi:hypothetical protein
MAFKERMQKAGFLPDMGKMQTQLDEKFDKLYAVLIEIRDELRTQRGAP